MNASRKVIVTGGTRGIGAQISLTLHKAGYSVISTFRSNAEAADTFHKNSGVTVVECNAADMEACERLVESIGGVDILINNAGVTADTPIWKMTHSQWQDVIDTNLGGCFNMSRSFFPMMRENGFGRIVNISSINGLTGQFGQVNYSASKAGVLGLTKALAKEGAKYGVTVNAIAPGYIATDMLDKVPDQVIQSIIQNIPIGRLGDPEEIARAVKFLVEDEAGFITGETLNINGGHYMG